MSEHAGFPDAQTGVDAGDGGGEVAVETVEGEEGVLDADVEDLGEGEGVAEVDCGVGENERAVGELDDAGVVGVVDGRDEVAVGGEVFGEGGVDLAGGAVAG